MQRTRTISRRGMLNSSFTSTASPEENYRSFGIGARLLEIVKEAGQVGDIINMQWQTPDFNVKAIKFYKRIGGIGKAKIRFILPL